MQIQKTGQGIAGRDLWLITFLEPHYPGKFPAHHDGNYAVEQNSSLCNKLFRQVAGTASRRLTKTSNFIKCIKRKYLPQILEMTVGWCYKTKKV